MTLFKRLDILRADLSEIVANSGATKEQKNLAATLHEAALNFQAALDQETGDVHRLTT